MPFSKNGIGRFFARTFDRDALTNVMPPHIARTTTLLVASDFAGSHGSLHFDTYSFLVMTLESNRPWLDYQRIFRTRVLRSNRRIAFKGLADKLKRASMPAFLDMGSEIDGSLITFAIAKNAGPLFEESSPYEDSEILLVNWPKKHVKERLLRVLHLGGFLLSGLSAPAQNILWITDEDEIASNVGQLIALTTVFGRVASGYLSHDLGRMRCGTTKSDDGSLVLEDVAAYADLAAGAVSELLTELRGERDKLTRGIMTMVSSKLSWKARGIAQWLADTSGRLKRRTVFLDINPITDRLRVAELQLHAQPMDSQLIIP
jgi:hypothetical protein